MTHLNIEVKARCAQPNRVREVLQQQNARFVGEDHQIDTYFKVPNGRLKLREGDIENALIHYQRSDQARPKQSEVLLYQSAPDTSLKPLLARALGVLAVVDKRREIYFIDNVKFHIDRVKNLGSFVEIEAISENGEFTAAQLREQCAHFVHLLGIEDEDLLTHSYSDMIERSADL
jgi:predicted adenylyl cyclase CyaB